MMAPLARLRLRLTLWYAATFAVILVALGGGLLVAMRQWLSHRLDHSLQVASAALIRATHTLEQERATTGVSDAVEELHIPDRDLYLLDTTGRPLTPARADAWIVAAARTAVRTGRAQINAESPDGREIRVYAESFTGQGGATYVAAVGADRMEFDDQNAALLGAFAGAALVALLLVTGGGFVLARKSTIPVERSMEQTRRFMADAAHELRTPVAVLRARAEVALAHARDPARDDATLRAIEGESDRLGVIVGDLLTLARADAGERPVAREPLYLDDIAADALEAARALAQRKGVVLEVGSFEEARITGDPALVRRLLIIVLDNAIKYTP